MTVTNRTRGTVLGNSIDVAFTFDRRKIGLLNRKNLTPGEGLLISKCHSIHTFGMNFPIDVVFLDDQGRVLDLSPNLQPGRLAKRAASFSVLELPVGMIQASGTQKGDVLGGIQ